MRRPSLFVSVLAVAVLALVAFPAAGPAAAQEATPDTSPNPEECVVAPRALEDLRALVGTPAPRGAGEATEIARASPPTAVELPVGEPADAATAEAITRAVRRQIACFNAGDFLRGFAGTTDEFVAAQVDVALFDEEFVAVLVGTPQPLAEDQQTQLLGVRDATVYPDGRAGALVDYFGPTSPPDSLTGQETDLWIFEQVDGEWLLDEVVPNLEGRHGPAATPAA